MFSEGDLTRYKQQILYTSFEQEGQEKLKYSQVVVTGVGGLGTVKSLYLVRARVGHIPLVDRDCVELLNLNRQILY